MSWPSRLLCGAGKSVSLRPRIYHTAGWLLHRYRSGLDVLEGKHFGFRQRKGPEKCLPNESDYQASFDIQVGCGRPGREHRSRKVHDGTAVIGELHMLLRSFPCKSHLAIDVTALHVLGRLLSIGFLSFATSDPSLPKYASGCFRGSVQEARYCTIRM